VQPGALLPAPHPRMSCPPRSRSPRPELRLLHADPVPLPSRAFVAIGARCHTPNGPTRTQKVLN
jgi:hypothetical protein